MTTRQNILKLALDKSRKKGKEEGKALALLHANEGAQNNLRAFIANLN